DPGRRSPRHGRVRGDLERRSGEFRRRGSGRTERAFEVRMQPVEDLVRGRSSRTEEPEGVRGPTGRGASEPTVCAQRDAEEARIAVSLRTRSATSPERAGEA